MLAKAKRYSTKEFNVVFSNNTTKHSSHLIRLVPVDPVLQSKYAVVVSKKTYKRRVDRNKIRRFVYNVLRNHPVKGGGIIMVKKQANNFLDLLRTNKITATTEVLDLFS